MAVLVRVSKAVSVHRLGLRGSWFNVWGAKIDKGVFARELGPYAAMRAQWLCQCGSTNTFQPVRHRYA